MIQFTVIHQIPCNINTYWSLFKSTTFNDALYRAIIGFATVQLLQQTETQTEILRKASGAPNAGLPEPMASFVGTNFGYVIDSRADKTTNVWTFTWTPNAHADVLKLQGTVKVVPVGDNAVQCTADITFEANVFAIGGGIEFFVQTQVTDGWKTGADFAGKWIADGKTIS